MQKTTMNQPLSYLHLGFTIILSVALGWTAWRISKLEKLRSEFFTGSVKKNLEEVLVDQNRKLTQIDKDLKSLDKNLTDLAVLNKNNIQKIGFVRFNPFDDAGSNMSFVLALLNQDGNGVVISSLHSRQGTRIYAKNIKQGQSDSKLTEEEQQAISSAK